MASGDTQRAVGSGVMDPEQTAAGSALTAAPSAAGAAGSALTAATAAVPAGAGAAGADTAGNYTITTNLVTNNALRIVELETKTTALETGIATTNTNRTRIDELETKTTALETALARLGLFS